MGDLIFTKIPFFCADMYIQNLPKLKVSAPNLATKIEQSNLIRSLKKYGDLYATSTDYYPDLPRIGGQNIFKESYTLHMAFKEPFDEYKSVSIIEISGHGQTKQFAYDNLVKHINNLWEYEDLLLHCYRTNVAPYNQYCYFIYDPSEIQQHNLMQPTKNLSQFPAERAEPNLCGHIYTNAVFSFLGRSR